ncbi:hypothetical protein [Streptomyces sp. Z26]|uniref:hypothetical protein n=1 Tax=Streptomyces sp. Z26 TaxID=2500177 RepID=UPI0014055FCE|nr:hypothetical protein [Streptomyces sp. Z26]
MNTPDPAFPYPRVQHVVAVDLTSEDYWEHGAVITDLREQSRHLGDAVHVRVQIGATALRVGGMRLEQAIAHAFYGVASIDIEVPGTHGGGRLFVEGVDRWVRLARQAAAEPVPGYLAAPTTADPWNTTPATG